MQQEIETVTAMALQEASLPPVPQGHEEGAAAAVGRDDGRQANSWMITKFEPSQKEINLFNLNGLTKGVRYAAWQVEKCPTTGRVHMHIYLQLNRSQRRKWVQAIELTDAEGSKFKPFENCHCDIPRGSPEQARDYCQKPEGHIPAEQGGGRWNMGEFKTQGQRTDIKEAGAAILAGRKLTEIDPAVLVKYAGNLLKIQQFVTPPDRRGKLKIITIIGGTGIGKSWATRDLYPNAFVHNTGNSGGWFDGYQHHEVVVFEEYKGHIPLGKFLNLLDPFPLRVEVKGAYVPAFYTVVFIISNSAPNEWYANIDERRGSELAALYRRLSYPEGPTYIEIDKSKGVEDGREELHQKLKLALVGATPEPAPDPYFAQQEAAAAREEEERHIVARAMSGEESMAMVIDEEAAAATQEEEHEEEESCALAGPKALKRGRAMIIASDGETMARACTLQSLLQSVDEELIAQQGH